MRNFYDEAIEKLKIPFAIAELQMKDIREAAVSGRFLFALEVGCGKTVCATVAAKMLDAPYNIVICPPIILNQWEDWLNEIGISDTSIYRGANRTIDMLEHNWVLMSHAIFRDSFNIINEFYEGKEISLIVDEAQYLKNSASKLFKCVDKFVYDDCRPLREKFIYADGHTYIKAGRYICIHKTQNPTTL